MSFKIWNAATVGGNVCMSLPAGAMISLTAALEGVCTLWPQNGKPRQVPVVDFVTGMHTNVLQKGELLRSILLPASALTKRFAMRQVSLTHLGRSAALIVATVKRQRRGFPADHQRRDAAAGASALRQDAVGRRAAPGDRRSACRRTPGSTTSTARRPTSATSPSIWPNRFARSCHEQIRGQRPPLLGRTEARPVPAHLPARPGSVRRQEGLRCRRLRRLHGVARRQAVPFLPGARLPRRGPQDHHHRGPGQERRAASDPAGLPRRAGLPVRLLRRRHDDDDGLGRVRRGAQGRPAACPQGQHLPLHRLPLDRRRAARQEATSRRTSPARRSAPACPTRSPTPS